MAPRGSRTSSSDTAQFLARSHFIPKQDKCIFISQPCRDVRLNGTIWTEDLIIFHTASCREVLTSTLSLSHSLPIHSYYTTLTLSSTHTYSSPHSNGKLHTATATTPIHETSSVDLFTFPSLDFRDVPVAVLAGATAVCPDVLVADIDALVVAMADVDVDSEGEEVERGMMVLLVV